MILWFLRMYTLVRIQKLFHLIISREKFRKNDFQIFIFLNFLFVFISLFISRIMFWSKSEYFPKGKFRKSRLIFRALSILAFEEVFD